jgi:hypothetical protein
MYLEASQAISNPFPETLRIIAKVISLIMVIGFLESKHYYEISRKSLQNYMKKEEHRWRNLK